MIPAGFDEIGVRLDLLALGWGGLLALLFAAICGVLWYHVGDELSLWGLSAGFGGIVGACVGAIWVLMMIPFNGAYQHDYRVEGHVIAVSNVLGDASGELTRTPVATLDSVDRPLVIDDPRAVGLKGQDVVLKCNIEWHFRAADSYSCKIIEFGGAR